MKEEKKLKDEKASKVKKLIAKKDHTILHNEHHIKIKKGDEVEVPEKFIATLKTENVI